MTTPGSQHPQQRFAGLPAAMLAVTVLLLLVLAGGLGGELYARSKANSLVADAVQCEANDTATVSFATSPPVLAQYFNGQYPDISITTAGNQLREVKGMKLALNIHNIRVNKTADSKGTIGSLNGTLDWTTEGIKDSVQSVVPGIGSLVASTVTTDPSAGTLELKGLLDHATVKPQVNNGVLSLHVESLSALGLHISSETVQTNLDELANKATQNLPLGIQIDSVAVTADGVTAKFSATNSTIPNSSNACFAKL